MPHRYRLEVTRGAMRVSREWEPGEDGKVSPYTGGGGSNRGVAGPSTAGRVGLKFSARARGRMRWQFSALPWELLGQRVVMITLTYPADWRTWCPDAVALVRARELLYKRWGRHFGALPVGVWVVEFQPRERRPPEQRRAPHLHLYVGLPDEVPWEEYLGYAARTRKRVADEGRLGSYEARGRLRAPTGDFAMWLRTQWWQVVGSGEKTHHGRGVDIAAAFWSEGAEAAADRARVADYFWRESGKWAQKLAPDDFGGLRYWGVWGRKQGFVPMVGERELSERVYVEKRRVMRKFVAGRVKHDFVTRGSGGKYKPYRGPRGLDGMTVFDIDGPTVAGRLQRWAEAHVLANPRPVGQRRRRERPVEAEQPGGGELVVVGGDERAGWLLGREAV